MIPNTFDCPPQHCGWPTMVPSEHQSPGLANCEPVLPGLLRQMIHHDEWLGLAEGDENVLL